MEIAKTILGVAGALLIGAIVGIEAEKWLGVSRWLGTKIFGTVATLLVVWVL